jgi:plasmid replication initiation protein
LFDIGLSELKLDMGVVNSNLPDVRRILNNGKGTEDEYDRAVAKSPDKMYNVWNKFNKQCLEPTVNEINEKSDIYVEYRPKTRGKGGKVYAVEFTTYLNGAEKDKNDGSVVPVALDDEGDIQPQIPDEDKFVIALEVGNILSDLKLAYPDILSICEAARYNKEDIQKAYEVLKNSRSKIENVTGWMISAIRNNYKDVSAQSVTSEKKNNRFNNFDQREYDYDELEKMLLNKPVN